MDHWKVGDGFAIRYGGYKGIQWYFGDNFRSAGGGIPLPPVHPVAIAVEAARVAALFLQWWEMRKTNTLLAAQFEERRIPWILDMLSTLANELSDGNSVRLDTLRYLDRDISRFLAHSEKNPVIDCPSSFLLQIERTAQALSAINSALDQELPLSPTLPLKTGDQRFRYRALDTFEADPDPAASLTRYFESAARAISPGPLAAALALTFSPSHVLLAAGAALVVWFAERRQRQQEEHAEAFSALYRLAYEVRSLHALLSDAGAFPPVVRVFSLEDLRAGRPGTVRSVPADEER